MLLDETYIDIREELAAAEARAQDCTDAVTALQQQWNAALAEKEAADAYVQALKAILARDTNPVATATDKFRTFGEGATQ